MIFVLAKDKPALFLMLSEMDVASMRDGRTVFVDDRQLGSATFDQVVLSLHATDQAAINLLKEHGKVPPEFGVTVFPGPKEDEGRCDKCKGCIPKSSLFEGKCIVCWATIAKRLSGQVPRVVERSRVLPDFLVHGPWPLACPCGRPLDLFCKHGSGEEGEQWGVGHLERACSPFVTAGSLGALMIELVQIFLKNGRLMTAQEYFQGRGAEEGKDNL